MIFQPNTLGEYKKQYVSRKRLLELKDLHWKFPCSTGLCNICELVKRHERRDYLKGLRSK